MQKIAIPGVRDAQVAGKRVLVRADLDVPIDMTRGKPQVADDSRIRALLPTLNYLSEQKARIIIIAHLGRPAGVAVEALRMAPVEARLRELCTTPFELHENLRFYPGEEAGDEGFAKELADLGDIFVNEAFADSHREHASIVGVPKYLPHYAGLCFLEEVERLSQAFAPTHPALAILGGAKFETKQPLIEKFAALYDRVLVGGAIANDLLRSRGFPVGSSKVSARPVSAAAAGSEKVAAPQDSVVVEEGTNTERATSVTDIRANESIVDIGEKTAAQWGEEIKKSAFVLWNGPMGVYEKGYTRGTDALAQALAGAECRVVLGGGDTAAALQKFSFDRKRIFISTGGGAMLQFLIDGTLPGIEALRRR